MPYRRARWWLSITAAECILWRMRHVSDRRCGWLGFSGPGGELAGTSPPTTSTITASTQPTPSTTTSPPPASATPCTATTEGLLVGAQPTDATGSSGACGHGSWRVAPTRRGSCCEVVPTQSHRPRTIASHRGLHTDWSGDGTSRFPAQRRMLSRRRQLWWVGLKPEDRHGPVRLASMLTRRLRTAQASAARAATPARHQLSSSKLVAAEIRATGWRSGDDPSFIRRRDPRRPTPMEPSPTCSSGSTLASRSPEMAYPGWPSSDAESSGAAVKHECHVSPTPLVTRRILGGGVSGRRRKRSEALPGADRPGSLGAGPNP